MSALDLRWLTVMARFTNIRIELLVLRELKALRDRPK